MLTPPSLSFSVCPVGFQVGHLPQDDGQQDSLYGHHNACASTTPVLVRLHRCHTHSSLVSALLSSVSFLCPGFSIINSIMIVLFLSGMVAVIMLRILHRDLTRYNNEQLSEEEQKEETGWKLIHGDVFRPPVHGGWLAILVGTGTQVFAMTMITLVFAALGFLSPANRGGLMSALLFLFVLMGVFRRLPLARASTRCSA